MAGLQEYKCPCCGGAIEFNSSVQKMKCPYCDTEFEMETLAAYDDALSAEGADEMNWSSESSEVFSAEETSGMHVYSCASCGGEIIGDDTLGATACPYCGNPIVMMGQFQGDLKPGHIIPFKLNKAAAKAKLLEHMSGKKFLPKVFKDQNHIDEVKGLYVPFWLFDSEADASFRYRGTKVRQWRDSDYEYRETSYYSIRRDGNLSFARVPMDGSSKIDDTLMESLEPFDYREAVPFQSAYLAGYMADRYDVTQEDCAPHVNERIKNSTSDVFRNTVKGYDTVNQEVGNIHLRGGKVSYVLYPVWILNTTWNGEKFTFAMNGQTGKFVGNLPLDKAAYKKSLMMVSGIAAIVMFGIMMLF